MKLLNEELKARYANLIKKPRAGAALLVLIAAGLAYVYFTNSNVELGTAILDKPHKETYEYYDQKLDVRMQIPVGWNAVDDEPAPREGIYKPILTLKSGSCTMAMATLDEDVFHDKYRQVSFGLKMSYDGNLTGSSWYAPKNAVPEGFEFDYDARRHYFQGEFRVARMLRGPWIEQIENKPAASFVLYDSVTGSVSDECEFDFVQMATSFKQEFDELADYDPETRYVLLTKPDDRFKTYFYRLSAANELEPILDGKGEQIVFNQNPHPGQDLLGAEDFLVFPNPNGEPTRLGLYDVPAKTFTEIELGNEDVIGHKIDGNRVVDFVRAGQRIYFTFGTKSCGEYRGECNAGLYVYDVSTGLTSQIRSNISAYEVGYDFTHDIVSILGGFGDGGEFSFGYEFFDAKNGYASLGTFSYNSDNQDDPAALERHQRIQNGDFK